MENVSLLIFTLLGQAAIGIVLCTAIAQQFNQEAVFKVPLVTAAGLAIVGILASFLHLGRPLAAVHTLTQFGTSWLSREIWFSSVFAGLVVVIALLVLFKPSVKRLIKILIPIAALVGLADVYVMASSYNFTSVPAWKTGATLVQFYTVMISVGAALFLGLGGKETVNMRKWGIAAACAAIGIQVAAMIHYYLQLGTSVSAAAQQSAALLESMNLELMLQWLLILTGAGLALSTLKNQKSAAVAAEPMVITNRRVLLFALSALIMGQIAGRYLFYAIMVTSQVGLN